MIPGVSVWTFDSRVRVVTRVIQIGRGWCHEKFGVRSIRFGSRSFFSVHLKYIETHVDSGGRWKGDERGAGERVHARTLTGNVLAIWFLSACAHPEICATDQVIVSAYPCLDAISFGRLRALSPNEILEVKLDRQLIRATINFSAESLETKFLRIVVPIFVVLTIFFFTLTTLLGKSINDQSAIDSFARDGIPTRWTSRPWPRLFLSARREINDSTLTENHYRRYSADSDRWSS